MPSNRLLGTLLVCVLVIGTAAPTTAAAQDASVAIDTVCPAPVDEPVDILATATIPDGPFDDVPVDVTLSIDGSTVTTKTATVDGAETVTVPFTYTYRSTGTHEIRIDAAGSAFGQTFEAAATNDVEVVTDTSTGGSYPACDSGTQTSTNADEFTASSADGDGANAPVVPTAALDSGGWERLSAVDNRVLEREIAGVSIVADAHTVVYADTAVEADLEERTLGKLSPTTNLFTATQIDVDPDVSTLPFDESVVMDTVREEVTANFVAELEATGLTNVERDGSETITVASGTTVEVERYTAEYPLDGIDISLFAGQTMSIEPTDAVIEGWIAIWREGDAIMVVSGMYPGENVAFSQTTDLNDAISVTVDVDLGFDPDGYQGELFELISATRAGGQTSSDTASIAWRGLA